MKYVLQKMSQIETEKIEAKLSEHNVELKSINAIVDATMKAQAELDKFNGIYEKLAAQADQARQSGEKYINLITRLDEDLSAFDKAARAIGINPNEYKEVQNAKSLKSNGNPTVITGMINDAKKLI